MKLHLPKSLRGALLACFASVAGLTTTVATGTFAGGAFYVSLASMAQAEDVSVTSSTTWSNADAATHADDSVTVGDADAEDAITLQVGNGGTNALTAGSSIDFGTVTVNSGDTLKLHAWTTTTTTPGSDGKVSIQSAITLNSGSELWIEDGSYYFAENITVSGAASVRSKWGKGITLGALTGDEDAVLTLVHGIATDTVEYDTARAVFELDAANESFEGTVKLEDDNGSNTGQQDGVQLILSNAKALVNAVLDFGETEDVVLSLNATKVLLKAIKGHGFVEYYNSTSTVGEIELTDATGTFSGSSAANVNWTISGGNQGLSNASILGTYTVGKSASSAFEGAITLGALVNNSTTGIDVTNMTSLTINNQTAYQGATISGLGLLTGLSGNTFTYGNGWLATYDSATGTATLSDNSAIYWVDAGGADDTDNDWASPSNWQGGTVPSSTDTVRLGADAANKTIAFAADAAIGQARVVQGDYVFTTDGNVTLTGAISVVPTGASLSKAGAGTLTLTNVTANTLASSAGTLTVNTLNLYTGDTFTKTGAGLMTLTNADTLLGKNITVEAGELHIAQTGNVQVTAGSATTVTVKSGATLDDDRRLNVTGGSFTVTGGGVYELEGISLSAAAKAATTLNVQADTVLHITGGTQDASGQLGSFMLSHWDANNTININGLLVSDVGISDRDGSGTLHVEDGGVLQFNQGGLSRSYHSGTSKDTVINVKNGGSLVVNGDKTDYTDYITTNLAEGATVFTTSGATILNAMNYNGTVKLGAAADTILSLTATTPNVGTITILGTGDTVKTFANDAVSQTAAGGTVKYTDTVSGTAITLNAGAKFEAAAGLNLSGTLTLAANSEAKLGGAVTVGSIANSGTIDVSELQSLRLGADSGSMGATVNLGAVSSYTEGKTFTYGNGWTATWQDDGRALITGDSAIAWADTGAEGDTDINWNTADNWSGAAAPTATDYVQLAATEGVTRTLTLTADTTVAGLRVYDAYTLSVGEGTTASFTATNGIELNGDTAKLSKAGTGTLSMTAAQAIAAKMSVTEGTLKLTDRLPGDAESNDNTGAITYEADLTALTVGSNGVLSILAAEKNSNNRTTVKLANFDGVLEITGGFVDTDSTFANATIKVNGGGLLSRVPAGDIANKVIIGDSGATFYSLGSTGVDGTWKTKFTGAMSGAGTLTIQERGDWYFAGDMSGFTGGIVLNSNYDHVYFQTSATVQSFSASARVGDNSVVHFGDGTNKTLFTIKDAMTVGVATTFELTANAGVKNENQVSVSDNITFVLKGAGQYDMAGWLNLGTNSKLDIQETVSLNLAHTTQTVSSGEIAIATDATVNDSRALTIDGAYNISGAGAYNQLGSLALTSNGALTLSGVVSINSLAGNNAGTITFADTLTSLELKDFTLGADYNIGTVTNGENVDWGTLLGYDSGVDFSYADGILSSVSLGVISWASPADEDITWGGANWKGANSTNFVSISAADSVVLDVRAADSDISPTIELTANTTVAGLVVNDAYNLSIAEGATYSFAADSYGFGANGSLSKTGAGTLSMSLAQAQASKMHISEGTLKLTDVNFANGSTQDLSAITSGADGVLQLNASANGYQSGTHYGVTFTFSDDFLGTLKFTSGQVNVKNSSEEESYFGGAQKIILSQATLAFNGGTLSVPELVIDDATTTSHDATFLVYGNATIESALSGSGQVVRLKDNGYTLNLTGTINLTGTFINQSGNLNINSFTSAHFGLLKNTGGTTTISSAIGSDSYIEVTGGTLTIEATADLGRVTQSNGTININSAADISELSVTGGTFKINGAEVGVTTLKTGSALTLTGAAHLTAGLEDGSAVTLNGADTASATLTVTENGTANLQTGLVLDTLTVNAGGTLALNGEVTLDNLVNNAQLDLTNLTSLTLTQQQAYDGAVITGLGSLTGLTNNHFTYADGWLAEYDATNRTATILANAIWSDGGDDDNIIWADASNWTGGGTAGYTLQETDRVRLGTEAAGKQILVTADSTVAGITVRAPYTFSVADTESWTLTAPITFLENGAITKTGAGSLTLTSDLVTNELTVNEGTLTTGDVTPATGTTFTQSGSGTLVVDAVTANEVSVAGSMSATTAATADGTTFTKSGAGSLNVGTLTANEANVTGNMSATAVNLSDGNAFTKSGEGAMEIGTLNANSATVSAGSLSVDTATLKSGNTFTKAGANALELGTTNATRLTVSEGDLKMTAWTLAAGTTATKTGDGTLTIAGDASALKGNLDVSDGDVTFETDAAFGTLAVRENHVYIGTESKNVNVSFTSSTYSGFSGHMDVAAGSTLTAESVSVNNSTYRLHGAGVYNIGKLSLATSNTGNMLVDTGLTVNVTGTTTTGTTDGSFVLGVSASTIDVYGTLSLASGISATANSTNHVVNVGDGSNAGATLWLKDGLHAAVAENVSAVATINVKTGSNLIVDSANTANSDKFTVNLADGATVFTTAGGTILNAMQYTGTVKLGAAAGTTLDLTHAEQTDVNALSILGTADAVKGTNAGGTVAFAGKVSGASVTLNEGGRLTAAGGLNLTGALTLNSNAFATLNGEVSVGSLSNAGSIDVSGISALAIGDFALTSGATYNVGTLTGYESLNWNTLLGANESLSIAYNADTGYLSIATNMENPILWMGAEGATWDSTASDGSDTASWMQGDAAYAITPDSAVVLGNAATLGDSSDAVSRTIVLDADTVVNSVTVQDAYALSVGADSSYSFDVGSIALEQGGSLSKTGEGTLSMSLEDAVAAQMAVNAGVLQISGVLADTAGGTAVGLSAISGSGTLHISPAGVNGNTNDGTRTAVSLGDAFTGTLKVSGGQLDAASTMGGAALVILDGATLTATGSAVTELAWNIQVSDNDAHLRHYGNTGVDERTSYATRLTGALSGGAGAMLTVIDAGEWFFAGDMSNYAGGLSINGNTNYVTFASDATLASLAATAGSRVLVTNSATVGATTTATSGTGTVYAGADANATLNLGAVTIANGTTLDITGGGTHTADSVNMSAAATGLTLGANTSLTVTGALNGDGNTDTETLTITLGENARLSLGSAAHTQTIGSTIEISLGAKSLLTDAAVRRLGNSHLNITGSGVYELNALQLSNGANANTSVTIGAGATLHITGTTLNASGDGGSLLTGTQNYDNVITVNGTLALECGVSRYNIDDTANTINVNSGGKIAFNQGLTAANEGNDAAKDIINIKDGAVLEVSGTNTTGTNKLTVNIEQNGMVMGGNAGDVTESTIANNLVFANGAYIGAKAGTTLNIAPEADSMSIRWMDIIGTADAQGIAQGAGGKVAFAKAVTATETVKVLAGATAEFKQGLTVSGGNGLENYGTLTLNGANLNQFTNAANSSATFQGAITIAAMAGRNAGTIDVAGATSLALGDFSLTDGATYTIGALTGLSDTHTIGSLLGAGQYHDVTYDGTSTVSVVSHLVWDAQSATEGDNVWNTAADNLNWKVDTDTEKAFAADKVVVFAPNTDAVNSTVVLGEDVAASEVRLLGAYTFQTDADRTLSGAVKLLADDAALSKSGAGTLTLTEAVALNAASELTVREGTLKLESGVVLADGAASFTKNGAGVLELGNAETLLYKNLNVTGGVLNITQTGESNNLYSNSFTVADGAEVNDSRRLGSTETLTFSGGGVYNVAGIALSRQGLYDSTLNVDADTTLHITGTDVVGEAGVATDGSGGAFLLGHFAANNTVNIRGTLISDAGLSNLNASPTINVENGGTLQLNAGLSGSNYNLNESTDVTLNVNSGGVLVVNSSNTTNTDRINVELDQATVFTTEGATIANDMSYNSTVSLGAAQNKTLSLTKAGQVNMNKLTILGTADAVNGVDAGGEVVFSSKVSGMGITLNEGAQFAADGGLNLRGALTLRSNALATLSGDVYVGSLDNAGSLDVSGVSSLSIGAIDFSVGQSYHVGTIVTSDTFTTDDFLALIGTGGDSSLKVSYDAATGMLSFDSSIYWLDGTEADNTNSLWSSAENWSTGGDDSFTLAGVTVKLGAEATNRNVVLDSDVDANTTVHVAEAYTMTVQEGESHALNGRLEYAANDAAGLTKAGDGTLTMSLENATLGKGVHIADGTLEVLGSQTENSADGKVVAGGFAANGPHDLTAVSADATGTLSVKLYGNVNNNTFDTSALTLSDDFRGTLEVTHGYLMIHYSDTMKTTLGGTTKIRLDGGGVALRDNDTLDTAIEVGADGAWLMGRNAGNEYSGDITGAGTLTLVSNWGGDDVLTLSGSITLGDYETADDQGNPITAHSSIVKKGGSVVYITGDDNNINITGGVTAQGSGQLVFQNKQTLHSLAINGGTVSLEKDVTLGSMSMNAATLTVGTAATDEAEGTAATVTITSDAVRADNHNANRTVTLNSGSVVNDAAQWQLTGGTLTLNGEGVYNVAGMKLAADQASATTLTIESGTTLHVTGETDHATQNNGSFVLAHWNSANTVNVTGKLALECGISTHSNYTSQSNINVEDGGTIAFNQGLTAAGRDDAAIINIAGGGTLEVSGTDTTGTNLVTVNVADGAFIMGGNANGATGALIANNLVFNNGAYIGAKEGTTLTIAPEAGSMRINWLDIIGTDYGAGGKVVFGSDLSVGAALKILAGAEAEMQGNLTLTNVYGVANAGTLTLSGDVDAPTISNTNTGELIFDGAGLITLDDAMSNEGLIRFTNVDDMRITLDALEVSGSYGGAMRKWQIISNTGTLEGWTKDAISLDHFILNGETLSLEGDEWDGYELGTDGSLTLYQSYRYWDSAGEDSSLWDTESGTVWRDRTTMEGLTYEANSRVAFGEYEDGDDINGNPATLVELNKNVTVAEAGVLAKNLDVFGTGYVFEGGKITVTKALSIQQDATFNNTLVIGDATNALDINVDSGKTMTLNTLETLSVVKNGVLQYNAEGGSFRKTGEGILSITGAVAGVINSAAVEAGTLQLGDTVSLTVGANRITGGSLQNVVLNGAGTSISAFAKDSDAVLTDVQLNAGSSTAYATVQDVTFAGTSTLTGYITFEKTQSAQDMQVAAGGSLTISNLTLDLHGLAAGEKQIILNSATTEGLGSISNWDTVKLVYSGVAVNAGTVDLSTVGVVKIAEKGAALYWDGLADGSAAAIWNTTSTNWSAAAGTDGDSLFYALSDTYFGATPEGAAKEISLMQDVVMTNLFFTEGGYTIDGSYRMATLGDVKITHDSGDVTINTTLVAQGNIVGSGAGHVIFGGDTTAVRDITLENAAVTVGADMEAQGNISIASKAVAVNAGTMSAAGDISIESGSSAAGDAGSFTLASGTGLSATNITIDVDGGAESDDHFQDVYVNAEGSINATGTLTITGSAAKAFAGAVAAGDVVVDQTGNKVTFDMLTTNTLTITQGSTAHLLNTGASIRSVKLAGTLGFEKFAGAYGGHNIVSTSADAAVSFATITSVTLASLSGDTLTTDAEGNPLTYGSITFGTNYRNLTINRLSNIQNITIGAGEYGATFNNATGGIHGNLTLEGGKLTVNSANIMANGTGQWNISGNLVLGHNTQTLAGNTISLTNGFISGNATHTESSVDEKGEDITINVRNQGLAYTANATINYGGESTISANMTLAADTTLTLQAAHATGQAGGGDSRNSADSLLLSGSLSGSAALLLQGDGVVTVSGANADYNGTVTVGTESTLELANTAALSAATISVQDSGTLQLNAGGTVNVADLQLADGAALSIFGLAATDVPSLADAALLNTDAGISWVPNAEGNLTLHVLFDAELENMKTYNLFNDVQSLAASGVSLNVMHNGVALDASQYKVGYDAEAKLVYIRTMLGNIWSGGSLLDGESFTGDGIWAQAANNTDGNWTGKNYTESQAAIFVDLSAEHDNQIVTVTLADEVAPGDVYFEADKTYYKLISAAGDDTAGLAAGTNIHKAGSAYVYLGLVNNSTMENAIGSLDLQAGRIVLYSDLAVQGDVFIGKTAELRAYDFSLVKEAYTAKGQFSNLTMTDNAIRGASAENRGTVTSTYAAGQDVLIEAKDGQSVLLENMYLQTNQYKDGGDALRGVTIGENVDVTGNYTLYGAMVFNNTLANSGTVTLDAAMTAEIGKLDYQFSIDEDGASWYTYQLVQGGTINGMNDLLVSDVTIGGVSLGSDGLADGVATYISSADGSITLSIGNYVLDENGNKVTDENGQAKVDGTIGVPLWDERWHDNTDEQPSLSRRYAGTDAAANVTFGEGIDGNAEYYWYSSVVSAANADKVNGTGDEVVATLSSASTGNRAAGGSSAASSGLEMWIFDRSGFDTVIGGQYTDSLNNGWKQTAATHVLVNSVYDGADDDTEVDQKTWVVGGSWNTEQTADSHVTIQNGNILNVVGGTYGTNQEADSYVYVDGGTVYELFAGGYDAAEDASYYGDVANTYLSITGGTLGYHPDDSVRKRVYGGSYYGKVSGNVQITVDGDAVITDLVGGGYHGTVGGNITMDLVSGTVTGSIDAAGIGGSTVNGNVLVNLYQGFNLAEIYGGKQSSSGATVNGTSTLHFAEADTAYDLTQEKVQGFSHFTLADGAMVKVSTDSGSLRDASGVLTISGAGMVELVGGADIGRNITLVDGATLWFNSDDAGNYFSTADNRPTITATAGTTLEITGMPNNGQGLCFWVDLAGHGVDGKGAMYKGLSGAATVPTGKVALPRITLSDSASIGTDDNICVIENHNNESELFLNGNTLTKLGDNALMLYNTTVKDNTNANAVVDGTIYVKEGTLSTGYGMRAAKTNIVVGADTLLDVTNTGTADAVVGALSGSGNVSLSNNLTLTTSAAGSYGEGSDWMTQGADAYGQFSKDTGFAYGVYSGAVSGSMMLNIAGNGTQYLSGSESTFTGGVHLKESATLYLLGSTNGAATAAGSSSATSGVVGTGAIAWDSADATLYLGDGVRVYNNGTTNVAGSNMIIGVEAAPAGDALTNYAGTHTSVVLNGVEYVEIATHNLYSISCDGLYADGTTYVAGSAINRDKMLLVTKSEWDAGTATVQGFSSGGYNEATYSGVLGGQANLVKVGLGTLVLDQKNSYTGSTTIEAGTLALKGWAQIGGSSSSAALNVVQTEGSTLMLAYDGTYEGEITGISNNIALSGTGDARWTTESRTGNATASLISDVGGNVTFSLTGNISGDGNLLHSGAGTLVLSGDSTYTSGTHATGGVVEVQSATGMGAGAVQFEADAALHATVEAGTTASRLTTTLDEPGSYVKGKVNITGTDATERVLSVNTAGYTATNTTVDANGTLLVNGAGVQAATGTLGGTGKLVVSDATASGAKATVGALTEFTGDMVVEGNKAAIEVANGNYSGGSISISGQDAKLTTAGNINIAYGEKLELKSNGSAASGDGNTAAALSAAAVNVAAGGTLSVSNSDTAYRYNLAGLQQAASAAVNEMLDSGIAGSNQAMGSTATTDYTYHFDSSRALNAQTAGMVEGGLTLNSDSRYEERQANISLAGGALTLNTADGKIALDLLTNGNVQTYDDGYTSQIVLFSGVSSLTLDGTAYGEANAIMMMAAADGEAAAASNTVYSTLASNYFTGWNITDATHLVYDVGAGVVYLDKAVPEPTTTTLSILALAALVARRRRK